MDKLPPDTALLIIDVQEGLDDPAYGARNNPAAETRMAQLLAAWRATGRCSMCSTCHKGRIRRCIPAGPAFASRRR